MNLKTKLILIGILFYNISLFAQDKYLLSGIVSDQNNVPIPGVNVIVANTSRGAATDFDGNYELEVKAGEKIKFSFLGYISQTVTVTGQKKINISLAEDASQLDEVVVVGYGARKKSDITGAVSSVKSEELAAFPLGDATQALQGRAAGVVVQSNNGGEPGAPISIKIRGNTSINASSDPLIVVDGFVGASMPQANDIESMEVLKDASATAIYGSRGSNGVVMVTTKKGKSGKLSVELNTSYSVQNTANKLDLLNADEFANYQQTIAGNPGYVQGSGDTDWQDLLYRTGSTANHQFSFSGGSDNINFYASANYFKQDGIIINSDFEKLTFLSNIDAQVTDKLKLGMNLFGSIGAKNGVSTQSSGDSANGGGDDVISLMFRFTPDRGIKDPLTGKNTTNSIGENVDNPYAVATERVNETKTDNYRTNLYANYDILENLAFKTTFGFSSVNETIGTYVPSTLLANDGGKGGTAEINNRRSTTLLSENYLTYNAEIGKGALTLLAGYSYQKNKTFRFGAGAQDFIDDDFSFYNLSGSNVTLIPTSSLTEQEIQSQFGRMNYDYDDKYLLTATVRRDGSSNFAKNEKYAIFPSGAIGWKISNENFLKGNDKISNLKLRASYGLTGNQAISAYQSLASFDNISGMYGGDIVSAVVPNQAANADLKWETSYQTNIGLDLGMLNNKISLSLDYYNIDTKDLIIADTSQPVYLGFLTAASLRNVGEVNNKGFEINLNTKNIYNENFSWTTDFNWATNKNEIITLLNGKDILLDASPSYFSRQDTHILREGEAAGVFYGFESRGVWQGSTLPVGTATLAGAVAGDPLYTDVDESGVITSDDRKILGDPNPDYTFGITNSFTYKNFDLSIFFQGSQGGEIFNLTNVQLYNGDSNASKDVLNAWTPTNTSSNIPRIANRRDLSSRFIEDGSYIRLKNIALGYNLPEAITEKFGMSSVRITVSAQNLLTFTNYSGLDPEVNYFADSSSSSTGNTTQGFDFGNYPTIRAVNFSLNLKF
ncbi:TonB-linked SusC/RagA family outer membrane protein [Mariniflexile fucanivorans]|uniref:TonB-linked SusC/RagA family outer membrane protein n=1 Tax=Mariniflexile fucanivorans TaxID=264023 RepID=A0A4R1RL25_9FLAO|nr:TonB-dependent receptor [Mariniflexile fucanivorans]TCL66913.1 TonB-linked SusC/RagA family outer membrane protein [Mariniflexile fucanivorans]